MAGRNDELGLRARLLGELSFEFSGTPFPSFSRKGRALLAYLLISGKSVSRDELAALLWQPDRLASVRQALYELRHLPGAESWLIEEGERVVEVEGSTDYGDLRAALVAGEPEGVEVPFGTLLGEGFPSITPPFDDWLEQERRRLTELRLVSLDETARRLQDTGHHSEALRFIDGALSLDPLNESYYRTAMRLCQSLGESEVALSYYRRCEKVLERDLGLKPSAESRELATLIEQGKLRPLQGPPTTLPEPELRVAQALALADGELSVEAAAQVLSLPAFELAAELTKLERRGLIDEHLTIREPQRSNLLKEISAPLRRLLHERIAELLRDDDRADDALLARHLLAAGDAAAAAQRYVAAARQRLAHSQLDAAQALYFRALWAAAEAGEKGLKVRIEASFHLEGLAGQRGDSTLQDHVLEAAEQLAWKAQNDPLLAEARLRRARRLLQKGSVGEGLELALEGLEIALRLDDDTLVARARNAVGAAHYYAGDLDGAGEAFRSALVTNDEVERYRAHSNLGLLAGIGARLTEAYQQFEQALTLARSVGEQVDVAGTLNNLAATAERMGDYRRAVRHFKEGITLASRHEASGREGHLLVNLAVVYGRQGELGPAWNTTLEVEEFASNRGDLRLLGRAYELKAELAGRCGAHGPALEEIARAVEIAGEMEDERRWLMLSTQQAVLQAAQETGKDAATSAAGRDTTAAAESAAEAAIQALTDAQLVDIVPWLWLELSMVATRAEPALLRLQRAEAVGLRSMHQRTVHGIATLRTSLLPAESRSVRSEVKGLAAQAETSLASAADGSLEIVERPLLLLLLFIRQIQDREVPPEGLVPPQVRAELDEQAAGLPKALASSLLAAPERWLSPLKLGIQ